MKKRIGLSIFCFFILSFIAVISVEALEPLTKVQKTSNAIVPNVTGIPSDVALQILQMAGLNTKIQRGSSRTLTVDSQAPLAGTLVAVGSEIVLAVGGATIERPAQKEPEILTIEQTPEQKTQEMPKVLSVPQPSISYTQSTGSDVKTFLAWYPKKFLTRTQKDSSVPLLSRSTSNGSSNILGGKALNIVSSDKMPIIMAPTKGWQYGWVY